MNILTENMQDYIEAIYRVIEKNPVCRVTDLKNALNVSKPAVVNALAVLKKDGLITQEKYGYIELTAKGKKTAKSVFDKHKAISEFLMELFYLDKKRSEDMACRIEHIVSADVIKRMKGISSNIKKNKKLKESICGGINDFK